MAHDETAEAELVLLTEAEEEARENEDITLDCWVNDGRVDGLASGGTAEDCVSTAVGTTLVSKGRGVEIGAAGG